MPIPVTNVDGPGLALEIPGLSIGIAEYEEGPTGCTVFAFERPVSFESDIRGGSSGTINADIGLASAFCFAGGSLLGLEASTGVASALFDRRGHKHVDWMDVPLVAGAIIFDFGARKNGIYPDVGLGRAALEATAPGRFPLGRRGAGRNATVGKAIDFAMAEPGGQGAAIRHVDGAFVAVFTVLNALGAIHGRDGKVVRGNRRADGTRVAFTGPPSAEPGNTTLTLAVTNLKVDSRRLTQAARQAHSSMARAIQPFHTEFDGDTFFFATTNEVEHAGLLAPGALGTHHGRNRLGRHPCGVPGLALGHNLHQPVVTHGALVVFVRLQHLHLAKARLLVGPNGSRILNAWVYDDLPGASREKVFNDSPHHRGAKAALPVVGLADEKIDARRVLGVLEFIAGCVGNRIELEVANRNPLALHHPAVEVLFGDLLSAPLVRCLRIVVRLITAFVPLEHARVGEPVCHQPPVMLSRHKAPQDKSRHRSRDVTRRRRLSFR